MDGWQEIGDRVFRRMYHALRFNVGVVIGAEGALIVDTRGSELQARELLDDLRGLTTLPVRWVVNTHYHWDHTWGNSLFRGRPIWGHVECRNVMLTQDEKARDEIRHLFPDMRDELATLEVVPPDNVFSDSASLDLGGRTVDLRYLGLAHTNSDIAITVPDAGVVFAGDLIEEGAPPYFNDSYPLDWPETVERLLPFVSGTVVPGHGDVIDRAYVENQWRELQLLADLARQCNAGQLAPEDAARRGPFPEAVMQVALARASARA